MLKFLKTGELKKCKILTCYIITINNDENTTLMSQRKMSLLTLKTYFNIEIHIFFGIPGKKNIRQIDQLVHIIFTNQGT